MGGKMEGTMLPLPTNDDTSYSIISDFMELE